MATMQLADKTIVLDGAVDTVRYVQSRPRLLWVLREPNGGGPWDLREYFRDSLFKYSHWRMTAALMIRVSHGLLHGCLPWGTWAADARVIADTLRDVAAININKRGGGSTVDWSRLHSASREFSSIVGLQISLLSPQVVILAGTGTIVPPEFQRPCVSRPVGNNHVWLRDGVLFISAYHTNQRHISHQAYYEAIRRAVVQDAGSFVDSDNPTFFVNGPAS